MPEGVLRNPPTGPIAARRGRAVLSEVHVGASSTGSGTFAFSGAEVGDNVLAQSRASLGNVSAPQGFVSAPNVVTLIFATGGAALTISPTTAPTTFDVMVGQW